MATRPANETTSGTTEDQIDDPVDAIKAAFAGSADDAWTVKVYRVEGSSREKVPEAYLFECTIEELPVNDRVRDEYGAGQYRARVYRNSKLTNNITFNIETPRTRAESPRVNQTEGFAALVTAIQEGNRQTIELVEKMMSRSAPAAAQAAPDPISLMEKMSTIFANMRGAEPERRGGGGNGMEMFEKGIALAERFASSGGEGGTGFMDIFREIVKSGAVTNLLGAITNQNGAVQQPGQNVRQPGFRMPQMTPPIAPPNFANADQETAMKFVQEQVRYLITRAMNGSDPILYAEYVVDNLPPGTIDFILNSQNPIGDLAQIAPNVGNYVGWFEKLLEAIREYRQGQPEGVGGYASGASDDDAQNTGRGSGDAGHARDDGAASPPV